MKDYSVVERSAIEEVIAELEERRVKANEEIIRAQQNNLPQLVVMNRAEYYTTGIAIEKLRKKLQIPFEDLVEGVRLGMFDAKDVVIQLELEKQMTVFHQEEALPMAEMLVAVWRDEPMDTEVYQTFEDFRQKILRGEEDEWGFYLAYRIDPDLSKKIIETWKEVA